MVGHQYFGMPQYQIPQQRQYELIRVNGKNGAAAFNMPPNSSVLLLDNTAPIVWLKTTDGASYPSITGYSISPLEEEPEEKTDYSTLLERIERLEGIVNGKSDNSSTKQRKQSNASE